MNGINMNRWLLGGLAAGVVIWLLEGLGSVFYMEEMTAALEQFGLSMEMTAETWVLTILISVLTGLVAVYFYAASRTRFGPGPKTAVVVAVMLFLGAWLPSLIGFHMIGLYPDSMLFKWAIQGLIEIVAATLVGAWIYREASAG